MHWNVAGAKVLPVAAVEKSAVGASVDVGAGLVVVGDGCGGNAALVVEVAVPHERRYDGAPHRIERAATR